MDIRSKFIFAEVYATERAKGGFANRPAAIVEAVRFWNDVERQFKTDGIRIRMTDLALKIARSTDQPLTTEELINMVDTPIGEGQRPDTPKPDDDEELLLSDTILFGDLTDEEAMAEVNPHRRAVLPPVDIPASFMSPPFVVETDDDIQDVSNFGPPTDVEDDGIEINWGSSTGNEFGGDEDFDISDLFPPPPGLPLVYSNHAINLAQRVASATFREVLVISGELPNKVSPGTLVSWAEEVLAT